MNLRRLAIAGLAALALAGCASLLGTGSPAEATTVYGAERVYTTVGKLETAYLGSGVATKAQALFIKNVDNAVYADIVAGRTAIANKDSAAEAVALRLFNQAMPELRKLIPGAANVAN